MNFTHPKDTTEFGLGSVAEEVTADLPMITMEGARTIVLDHGISWDEFLDSFGSRSAYNTRSLFTWLGY